MANYISSITLPNGITYKLKDSEKTDTTYSAGTGITISGTTINNGGVRSIATGTSNGTISVNTNGSTKNIAVKGLGTAAYTSSSSYATAAQGTLALNAMPKSGGTFTGSVTLNADPTTNLGAATKQYVDENVIVSDTLANGVQIGKITSGNGSTTLYAPSPTTSTIAVTQSNTTPTLEFVESTNTSTSEILTGVLSVDSLQNGKMIVYMTKYTLPEALQSVQLTYSNGTVGSSYPLYLYGTKQSNVPYPGGTCLFLLYFNSAFYVINSNNIIL